ncbi:G-protein alpha subunit-domain-containing protein [Dactylonectria macrodidyma]|uniref:G-protein alpha subunit-domain-containing protein n=1 Tax=Dactylonectria macrodidyma TaxID=307937 RepID=A0A9P9JJ83_9HYPO|nr:G-protein alpha subunit-domain-containing protein [Dactylonectria macrodidyma]
MDPITAVGAVGAILGIIDVITKAIATLRDLQSQFTNASFTVTCIVAQLTALRAALAKIREWVDSEPVETHHQLIMDLGDAISCCGMLMDRLDAEFSKLRGAAGAQFNIKAKIKAALGGKSVNDLQNMIERQTSALNLLLTAYSCKTLAEQKSLLEKVRSRRAFRRIDDDVASLYVHRDSDSVVSQLTDTLTKISRDFVFDRLLWASKVYKDAAPGLIELVRERARHQAEARRQVQETARSEAIDKHIMEERLQAGKVIKAVIIGKDSSLANTFITALKANCLGSSSELSSEDTELIQNCMRRAVARLMDMSLCFVDEKGLTIGDYIDQLNVESHSQAFTDRTEAGARALQGLWSNEKFRDAMFETIDYFPSWAEWVVERADEITRTDYVPSHEDCLKAPQIGLGIRSAELDMDLLKLHLLNMADDRSSWTKINHHIENTTLIIFIVDLCRYNEVLDGRNQNGLMESLFHFDRVVNSMWCERSSILLLLLNVCEFRQKLTRNPLSNYFPDYSGSLDWFEAAKYIRRRFSQVNRAHLSLDSHFGEATDYNWRRLISSSVQNVILNRNLKAIGIL